MKFETHPIVDTNNKKIQCHGSSIIFINDTYYWYGENKEGITGNSLDPKSGCQFWHHGVKLYSSKDLLSWKDEGFVMKESDDIDNPFHPSNIMDRPHIIYNKNTNKYVMWCKSGFKKDFGFCSFSICVGDSLNDIKYIKMVNLYPHHAGDFDLFTYKDKAYVVYANPHTTMIIRELNDDYTDVTNKYSVHLHKPYPPYVREAPCVFIKDDRIYMLTSGTTGYYPNKTICYDITNIHGKWRYLNVPCIDDLREISYNLQFSSVLKVKDEYIAIGDRWLVDFNENAPNMDEVFKHIYSKGKEEGLTLTDEELASVSSMNVSLAESLFLPIEFINNQPIIRKPDK